MPDGRKQNGGSRPNSGRKSKAEELGLIATLEKCVTSEDREACLLKLAEDCRSEDFHERHESRKLLLAYVYGKPKESVQLAGEGGGPMVLKVVYDAKPRIDRSPS